MTQTAKILTREDMTEMLYTRAEEIFLLCAIITRRGIAHAFCELAGHVQRISCRIAAVDTNYQVSERQPNIAEMDARLVLPTPEECIYPDEIDTAFHRAMRDMDTFVAYLD